MKTTITILLISLIPHFLFSQIFKQLNLDLGLGMNNSGLFTTNHAQGLSFNGGVRYQYQSVEIGLRYEQTFTTLGVDDLGSFHQSGYFEKEDSEFSRYKSIQLILNFTPNFEYFKPIFGVGLTRNSFEKNRYFYTEFYQQIDTPFGEEAKESRAYFSVLLHLGFKIKKLRYSIFVHPRKGPHRAFIGTSLSYPISFGRKAELPKYILDMNMDGKSSPVILRFEVGRNLIVPLKKQYAATAVFLLSTQVTLYKKYALGFAFELTGSDMGKDKATVIYDYIDNNQALKHRFITRTTSLGSEISAFKGYLLRNIKHATNIDFFVGAGLGFYKINTVGSAKAYGKTYLPVVEKTKNLGLLLQTGFRTGIYTNKIEVNIPFGEIPMYLGLQTAIGLQFRKRKSKKSRMEFFNTKEE